MNLLENYLAALQLQHSTGEAVKETSFYPALATLLGGVGETLRPRVHCTINVKNRGAGIPDGGFFTESQRRALVKSEGENAFAAPLPAQIPERGVLEVKGAAENIDALAASDQVAKYLERYGLALITNLREWRLLERTDHGAAERERFSLAPDEAALWTTPPRVLAARHGARFEEFLRRALSFAAPLDNPGDLAFFLASYARDARERIESAPLPALDDLKRELETALDMEFEGEKGARFFRSTLVQTLFYGLFSGWLIHRRERGDAPFDWRLAEWSIHVPIVAALYEKVAGKSSVAALDVAAPLDLAAAALGRVQWDAFAKKFREDNAVQYFYEPFLEAFDPQLRRELGVWYTPPEIVRYMTQRVHHLLQSELGRADGLADPDVVILDPCCGTGAYLGEVLRVIASTLEERGDGALVGARLKQAACERVFGFELLPAPFVIAHWQVAQLLAERGAPLKDDERAAIYLTNALTGWQESAQQTIKDPAIREEADRARAVKGDQKILVILGNPPYNAFSGTAPQEEGDLVAAYKKGLQSDWGIKKYNLDDLYVRFFRVAERRLAQHVGSGATGEGILCFISNFSWTSEPSFVVMRESLLNSFDRIWIENLHGNRKISEYAPDGRTSETIFAQAGFSSGIQQGVTIGTLVRQKRDADEPHVAEVFYRDDLNAARAAERREQLLQSLDDAQLETRYERATPTRANRFSLRPQNVSREYSRWPRLTDLCAAPPSNGLMEKRGGALIDFSREALEKRMRAFCDVGTSFETLRAAAHPLTKTAARYEPKTARDKLLKIEGYRDANIARYAVRPFDVRWCYSTGVRPIWNEPRPTLRAQLWEGNAFLVSRPAGVSHPEGAPLWFTSVLGDNDALRGHAYYFPFFLRASTRKTGAMQSAMFESDAALQSVTANLSATARAYLSSLGFSQLDASRDEAALLWRHALAIGFAPSYRAEHADGLRADWPRVPLPQSRETLQNGARLGALVAQLLDASTRVNGVTAGKIRAELRPLGALSRTDGGQIDPDGGDLRVQAGWGHGGKGGVTMPGKGRIVRRAWRPDESAQLSEDAARWGDIACDIYLSDGKIAGVRDENYGVFLSGVPSAVWDYAIGGYAVLKKWLSYREYSLLGRDLTLDEASELSAIVRRLSALLTLQDGLDAHFAACAQDAAPWNTDSSNSL